MPEFFSIDTVKAYNKQLSCYMAWTNLETHKIIKKSLKYHTIILPISSNYEIIETIV